MNAVQGRKYLDRYVDQLGRVAFGEEGSYGYAVVELHGEVRTALDSGAVVQGPHDARVREPRQKIELAAQPELGLSWGVFAQKLQREDTAVYDVPDLVYRGGIASAEKRQHLIAVRQHLRRLDCSWLQHAPIVAMECRTVNVTATIA